MIEGDLCPKCEKGKLRKVMDEVAKGIKVEAYKCNKCNEVWYSQEIMEKIEAMEKAKFEERHLIKVGNSIAAVIPAKIAKNLKLKEKGKIYVTQENGEIIIRAAVV